jgi:hypothetical protein
MSLVAIATGDTQMAKSELIPESGPGRAPILLAASLANLLKLALPAVACIWFAAYRFRNSSFGQNYSISEIVFGIGIKPVQYRLLVPGIFGNIFQSIFGPLSDQQLHMLFSFLDGAWLGLIMYAFDESLLVWGVVQHSARRIGVALLVAMIVLHYITPQHLNVYYASDIPAVFGATLMLYLARRPNPIRFLAIFSVFTINRETSIFLLPLILWQTANLRVGWRWLGVGVIVWATIKLVLFLFFRNNPGESASFFHEDQLRILRNIMLFSSPKLLVLAGIGGFAWIVPVFLFRDMPSQARWLSLLYLPFLAVMAAVGNLDELRLYGDMLPVLALQTTLYIDRVVEIRCRSESGDIQNPSDVATAKPAAPAY